MTHRTFPLALAAALFGALLLVGCELAPETPVPAPGDGVQALNRPLIGLSGIPISWSSTAEGHVNCPFDDFSIPSQKYYFSGGTGGLFLRPYGADVEPEATGDRIVQTFFGGGFGHAGILVVDDFKGGVVRLGPDVFDLRRLDETELRRLEASGQLSHGAMVMNHLNALIAGTGRFTPRWVAPDVVRWTDRTTGGYLVVMAVDTELESSDRIAAEIRTGLARLEQQYDVHDAVVNMSFGLYPCGAVQDFEAVKHGYRSFHEYLGDLARHNGFRDADGVHLRLIEMTDTADDPLRELTDEVGLGGGEHLYVASAGNYGLDVSLFPAGWPKVVSVTGSEEGQPDRRARIVNPQTGRLEPMFNAGEVMETGAWYRLSNPHDLNGRVALGQPLYIVGTSYVAPVVSLFSALDEAQDNHAGGAMLCGLSPDDRPWLAYYPDTGRLWDLPLEDAVNAFCP